MHLSFKYRRSEKSRQQRSAIRVILFLNCRGLWGSVFGSHCCRLGARYSQITDEMSSSVIVVCWSAERTEMSTRLYGKLPKQRFPDRTTGLH